MGHPEGSTSAQNPFKPSPGNVTYMSQHATTSTTTTSSAAILFLLLLLLQRRLLRRRLLVLLELRLQPAVSSINSCIIQGP